MDGILVFQVLKVLLIKTGKIQSLDLVGFITGLELKKTNCFVKKLDCDITTDKSPGQ